MKDHDDEQVSEGLNQIFEIINAKGDVGELKQIVERSSTGTGLNKEDSVAQHSD
jgi:hypothetical protein